MISVSAEIVERVRMEYLEMPGLSLTCRQARRLLNLDVDLCEQILAELVRENFLSRHPNGIFRRRATGRHPFRAGQHGVATAQKGGAHGLPSTSC